MGMPMTSTQKATIKLPNPTGVVAGGTASFRIPIGQQFHALYLKYAYNVTTQNVADFTQIRVILNGQVIQTFTGTWRDVMNQFEGRAASVGILEIPFYRKDMLTLAGIEETSINTGVADKNGISIKNFYIEVDLDAGMTIAATDLEMYALVSDAWGGGPGTIPFIRLEQRNPTGANTDFQISDLISTSGSPDKIALARTTFIPSTGSISTLKIDRNQYTIFDRTDALNRAMHNNGNRTAQAGYYMIDTGERGQSGEIIHLLGTTDFRYRLGVSGAMTLTCVSEYLGVLTS